MIQKIDLAHRLIASSQLTKHLGDVVTRLGKNKIHNFYSDFIEHAKHHDLDIDFIMKEFGVAQVSQTRRVRLL